MFVSICVINTTYTMKPNIIIIYPDNQDLLLGSNGPQFLPTLNSHIIDQGIEISNGFVSTPICCPSRAELLTGRYFHNIGPPYPPNGTCMHIDPYIPVFNTNTLFQIMHNNGYHTGAFGKIVNDMPYWCNTSQPTIHGFSRLYIPCNYLDYYGHVYFNKFENDSYTYSFTNTSYQSVDLYETSQIGNATIDWIDEMYSNQIENTNISFFALFGVHAPHFPATPAYWYQDRFNDTNLYKAPRTPNFNQHYDNRHWLLDTEPELTTDALSFVDQLYRNRLRSMLSVDDFIYELDVVLDKYNITNKTFMFYVSDNGYHLGQWRIPCDFRNIYETDIRVPWWIRGPNIKPKSSMNKIVSNVDIAPTIYELAGIDVDRDKYEVDGVSFAKYLFEDNDNEKDDDDDWRDMLLLEYIWHDNKTFGDYPIWFKNDTDYNFNKYPPAFSNNTNNENNNNYYWTDNSYMSSFRALRIINKTYNVTYGEYVDGNWTNKDLSNPLFYELYNLTKDPYQMNNIYDQTSNSEKDYLHETLAKYGACKSSQCP